MESLQFTVLQIPGFSCFFCQRFSGPPRCCRIRCFTETATKRQYNVTLLCGDGIGPEVVSVARKVLTVAGSLEGIQFQFQEMPIGGAALDAVGVPLPEETLSVAKQSDAVLLEAIDTNGIIMKNI